MKKAKGMKKVIELNKLNELLKDYNKYGHKEYESFEDFIFQTTDDGIPVWRYVLSGFGLVKWTDQFLQGYEESR